MAEQNASRTDERVSVGTGIKRRGVLAVAGAVLAGLMAKQVSQPASATSGTGGQGALILGSNGLNSPNSATTITLLQTANNFSTSQLFEADARAFTGTGTADIVGLTGGGRGSAAGVVGILGSVASGFPVGLNAGVYGTASSGGTTKAVYGHHQSNGYGVYGDAGMGGYGVTGVAIDQFGVFGVSSSGIGVLGQSNGSSASIGVQGSANQGVGVFGASNGNAGVLGITTAPGNAGLGGITNIAGTAAFAGTSTNPNAFAGFFTGDVLVNGNFTVVDPTKKHGAIAHPDGSYRILYCMESAESWLEDFGKGSLVNGKADVLLDPDFAAVVHTDDYHVFLTTYGVSQGLDVTAQRATGFSVQEHNSGTSNIRFGYRVVARPKSENKAARMAKFTIPDIKVMQPPAVPSVPMAKGSDAPPQPAPPPRSSPSAASTPATGAQGNASPSIQPIPPPRSG